MNWVEFNGWLWANWGGIVAGFAISLVFYWLSKKERKPKYFTRSYTVIEKAKEMTPGLTVHFNGHGEDLSNFTISRIAIWNKGKETIRKDDVPKLDPLRIVALKETKILSAEVIFSSSDANQFACSINKDKSVLTVAFEYFEWNEGTVIQVAHSGIGSCSLEVRGKVKGAGEITMALALVLNHNRLARIFRMLSRQRQMAYITLGTGIVLFISGIVMNIVPDSWGDQDHRISLQIARIVPFLLGFAYSSLGILALRRVMPKPIERVMNQPWG